MVLYFFQLAALPAFSMLGKVVLLARPTTRATTITTTAARGTYALIWAPSFAWKYRTSSRNHVVIA